MSDIKAIPLIEFNTDERFECYFIFGGYVIHCSVVELFGIFQFDASFQIALHEQSRNFIEKWTE